MQHFKLILILGTCLVLKTTMVAGAEMENSGEETANTSAVQAASNVRNEYREERERSSRNEMPIQNNNNIRVNVHGSDTRFTREDVSGGGNVVGNGSVNGGTLVAPVHEPIATYSRAAITPMIGITNYAGAWGSHIQNRISVGLGLELALTRLLSIEIEGGYGRFNIGYNYYNHNFNLYNVGGNAKLYLTRWVIQPWIGFGVSGFYYENMTHGPSSPYSTYSQWIGTIEPLAGLDVEVSRDLTVGVRGAYYFPSFNKPRTMDNGIYSFPYYEEAGAMNTNFYKVMANVKLSF